MRKKELIDAVTAKTEHKRRDVKDIIEATLQTLGEAVTEDRELNLLPFAKVKIQRVKQLQSARVTIAKLRQPIKTAEDTPSKD